MTASPIDPVKLEKLAEVAVKVGLQLQKDQDLVITAPLAALPLVRLLTKTRLSCRRWTGHHLLFRRGNHAFALSPRQ